MRKLPSGFDLQITKQILIEAEKQISVLFKIHSFSYISLKCSRWVPVQRTLSRSNFCFNFENVLPLELEVITL